MDPWANRYVSVETDMEADLSIQVGKDGDITVAINTTRGYVNAVIGNPANNSGEWKSKTIYNLFMD